MHLTRREFDTLLIYMMAEIALKRKANGVKLNYPKPSQPISPLSLVAPDGITANHVRQIGSKN